MKKLTQIFLLVVMAASVAFAQQSRDLNATKAVKNLTPLTENVLVPSIMESFEGTFPPAGWALYSPDGGTGWNQQTVGTTPIPGWTGGVVTPTPNGQGGTKMAFATWTTGGATENDQWLVTPQITVGANYTLEFYVRKFGAYSDIMDIKISTTTNQMAAFTTNLATLTWSASDSGWAYKNYSLANYNGQNIYIAYNEHVNDNQADGAAIFVDLVRVDVASGIQDNQQEASLKLFPNPVQNTLYVESPVTMNKIRVANILGQVMEETTLDSRKAQITTADYQPGVYFVTIETETGVISRKINVK
ncbi:MAG TPA: choice-of-anchor J domain-containing protein [Bacteroidales bacterium]|nr:choice-of-anchor J domain-containing protein [Bacteroidales bacterium]HSA42977.1 choice-of-anchor J domain-containing protein [Bacteroidales bacterium]